MSCVRSWEVPPASWSILGFSGESILKQVLPGGSLTDLLWSRFQDHIERRFCGTADPRKSTPRENVSQASLAGLRSKGKADFLTERTRRAYHRREPVIHSANRIDILSERISSEGLHKHECAIGLKGLFDMLRRTNLIAHALHGFEHGHKSL